MSEWLANTGAWIERHPGYASWVQAVGATLAVVAAVLVPALQARHTRQRLEADRRLRAKSLAIAIYPEMLHIRLSYRNICRHMQALIDRQKRDQGMVTAVAGVELAEDAKRFLLPVTESLRALVPQFYLLGEPVGPQVQMCIGRTMKYNDLLNMVFGTPTRVDIPVLLRIVEHSLVQAEACIASIEQTWHISADDTRAFGLPFTEPATPEPMSNSVESQARNKETV